MTHIDCPVCGEPIQPVPIVFGLPTDEVFQAAERGEVALGGCVVDGNEPDARCPACGADIRLGGPDPRVVPPQVGRRISLRAERVGDDQRFLDAWVDSAGALHIDGQDLGPGTAAVSDDGEYEWFRTIPASEVPRLIALLSGEPGDHILDLLAARYTGRGSYELERVIRESGIRSELSVWS